MNAQEQLRLWQRINEYAAACGADTSDATITTRRMEAVAKVEQTVNEIVQRLHSEAWPVQRLERGLIDLPANPTIHTSGLRSLKDALVKWIARGNMRHESTPDPRVPTTSNVSPHAEKDARDMGDRRKLYVCRVALTYYAYAESKEQAEAFMEEALDNIPDALTVAAEEVTDPAHHKPVDWWTRDEIVFADGDGPTLGEIMDGSAEGEG